MSEAASIPFQMLLVFGSAKLLAELFVRLKQPAIVGEIVAGVLIGPAVLGWIQPTAILSSLAQLGVMFLLFRVGLDVETAELMRVGPTAAAVALCGVIAPFGLGWAIMAISGAGRTESLFVAAAMVATSVGITAQVLASKGLLRETASQIILAAAVIDDILGLIVLAIVSSVANGRWNILDLCLTGFLAIAFTFMLARWGSTAVRQVLPSVQAKLQAGEVQFNVAMLFLFGLSLLAVYAGIAAIVGAFLAGMILANSVGPRVRDLTSGVGELLVPFFLVGIGLHLDVHVFTDRGILLIAISILVAAVLSKLIACALAAYRMGWTDMLRIGTGMVPRGEVGMVVAQIGLSLGVIPKPIYGVVVFMAVATTLIAPPMLNWSFRGAVPAEPVEDFQIG